ncbi:MAG: XRE family transcriptional regulator [Peptococcaceae bacterium]|nr:XRE family transcriptional regulator [Peptococcaceae bacterium]
MSRRVKANINAHVLAWARKTAGYVLEEAAHKIGISPEKLQAWETGEDKPTLRQLRIAAKVYKRPTALFYCSTTPPEPPDIADFRVLPGTGLKYIPELLYEIRRAFQRRAIALELTEQMGDTPVIFPLQADMSEPPDSLASRIREVLGITLATQFSWRDHYTAFRSWISAVEKTGTLVFHVGNIELVQMRGFSISERPFPVIGINSKDSPRGRIFTLIHELAHIVLQRGGVCDLNETEAESIEAYCNRVAGEVLVPKDALLHEETVVENGDNTVWEDWQLRALANRYMVSQEVILRRLLTFGKTTRSFYNQKREEYEEIYRREKAEGDGPVPHYRLILRDNGSTFTSLVLSAYYNEAISSRDLSNFLGGIKLDHVGRIEHALIGGEGGVEV